MNFFVRPVVACLCLVVASFAARAQNYSDIWFNPAESGWGLTIADHQSNLFAVWFTYRQDGKPTWYVIPGGTFTNGHKHFEGDIYATTGPAYSSAPFDPARVTVTKVGTATIDFASPGSATFGYSVAGVTQMKAIERQPFGNAAPAWGSDVTDIWYNPAESGWGLTLAQHGGDVFGVWFTYDTDGQPLWVVMPGVTFDGADKLTGSLYTTTGPYFGGPFDPSRVVVTPQGSATLTVNRQGAPDLGCSGSQTAAFASSLRGVSGAKTVCQQVFGNMPGELAEPVAMADLLPPGTTPAASPSTFEMDAQAWAVAQIPELARFTADIDAAARAAAAALAPRIAALPKEASGKQPSGRKEASASPGDVGMAIAGAQERFSTAPPGFSDGFSGSSTQGAATVTEGVAGGRSADGTISGSETHDVRVRATSADGTVGGEDITGEMGAEGSYCPRPDGTVTFKLHLRSGKQVFVGTQIAGGIEEYLIAGAAHVSDAAFIDHVDYDIRVQSSAQQLDGHKAFVDASYRGALSGGWDDMGGITVSQTSANYYRQGSGTSPAEAAQMRNAARSRAIRVLMGYLETLQRNWRDGQCVKIELSFFPDVVVPGSSNRIDARVVHKLEHADLTAPIDSSLAGAASLSPKRIAPSPGTFTYVAPDVPDQTATLTFTSTSRRGIGTASVTTRTIARSYKVDWTDGQGNHVYGTLCNSPTATNFTLSFESGTQIKGELDFTPTSGTGGTVHLSGQGAGGVVTYSGDGTYTVIDPLAIRFGITTETATFPGPNGPQTINVPGPGGDLPLTRIDHCL